MEKKNNKALAFILSFLTTAAFTINFENYKENDPVWISKFGRIVNGEGIQYIFVFLAIYLLCQYISSIQLAKKSRRNIYLLSVVISGCIVLGNWCSTFDTFFFDSVLFVGNCILFAGYFNVVLLTLKMIWHWAYKTESEVVAKNDLLNFVLDKWVVIFGIVATALSWIPFVILYWPGIASADGLRSLTFYYGKVEWTNHHPYLVSLIMGLCMDIGKQFGSDQWGIFVYTMMEVLLALITIGRILKYMKNLGAPYWLRGATIAFFAIFPFWKPLFYSLQKDPIYSLVLVNLTLMLVDFCGDAEKCRKSIRKNLGLAVLMLLLCLLRNNGVHVIICVLLMTLFILFKKDKVFKKIAKNVIICCCGTIVIYMLFIKIGLPLLNVTNPHTTQESFSVLFQQTARYQKYYKEDVSEEESDILNATFNEYEKFGELYRPDVSDPIKDKYKGEALFGNYLKVWFSQFTKHPLCYVEAFCYHSYKYWCPNIKAKNDNYISMVESERYIPDNYLDVSQLEKYEEQRSNVKLAVSTYKKIPVISLAYNAGIYFWILVLTIFLFAEKSNWRGLLITVPSAATILIAILSPVNGDLRYIMPAMCSVPVILMLLCIQRKCETKTVSVE